MWVRAFGGGRVQAEAPAGTGTFEEHKGDQCGWGRVGDGARQGMRWEEQAGDLTAHRSPNAVPITLLTAPTS